MKPDEILDALSGIRERFVLSADERRQNPKGKKQNGRWIRWTAAAACLVLVGGIVLRVLTMGGSSYVLAAAEYPENAPYPREEDYEKSGDWDAYSRAMEAWSNERRWKWEADTSPLSAMDGYFIRSTRQFLSGTGENRVFSPLNVYMALAMLAETTDGNSRAQLLELLGENDVESLRERANLAWRLTYSDDGMVTQVLANSLWLNENVSFREATVKTLAERYYASTFRGEMGSKEFTEALQNWLNEQTGGLLEEEASQIETYPSTILALASTVYFKGSWLDRFMESQTAPDTFHGAAGDEQADFMHSSESTAYYRGENFAAVHLRFRNAGWMWLILPDEDSSPDEVIRGDEVFEMLLHPDEYENRRTMKVNLSVPKFDVNATTDLIDGLTELGVTDVFDSAVSDFTPLTDRSELCVTEATHSARVTIDEEGCTAAAFTLIAVEESGMEIPPEEVDLNLNRPFLFAVTTQEGLLLFTGAVESLS